ncbi:hypothetical protein [Amphritea sp. HPY]|uniref:hypothetical protein n=1 Tax=Amphritea sp. HPY TaxID=3421652 RepID=UPI003D7F007C
MSLKEICAGSGVGSIDLASCTLFYFEGFQFEGFNLKQPDPKTESVTGFPSRQFATPYFTAMEWLFF